MSIGLIQNMDPAAEIFRPIHAVLSTNKIRESKDREMIFGAPIHSYHNLTFFFQDWKPREDNGLIHRLPPRIRPPAVSTFDPDPFTNSGPQTIAFRPSLLIKFSRNNLDILEFSVVSKTHVWNGVGDEISLHWFIYNSERLTRVLLHSHEQRLERYNVPVIGKKLFFFWVGFVIIFFIGSWFLVTV